MSVLSKLKSVAKSGELHVLDVGARGGCSGAPWTMSKYAHVHGFEPDEKECNRLNLFAVTVAKGRYPGGYTCHPVALGDADKTGTLHCPSEPGGSSLLPLLDPKDPRICLYPLITSYTEVGRVEVPVRRFDTIAEEYGIPSPVAVKADVQGGEMAVFEGMGAHLSTVLCVESEVEFNPMYAGQPLFGDVDRTLRAAGLKLWRLDHLVHYLMRHRDQLERSVTAAFDNVHTSHPGGCGKLFWANALFFRDPREVREQPNAKVRLLALATLMHAYGELDGAAYAERLADSVLHARGDCVQAPPSPDDRP